MCYVLKNMKFNIWIWNTKLKDAAERQKADSMPSRLDWHKNHRTTITVLIARDAAGHIIEIYMNNIYVPTSIDFCYYRKPVSWRPLMIIKLSNDFVLAIFAGVVFIYCWANLLPASYASYVNNPDSWLPLSFIIFVVTATRLSSFLILLNNDKAKVFP